MPKKKLNRHKNVYGSETNSLTTDNPDIEACRLIISPISRKRTPGLTEKGRSEPQQTVSVS